MVESGAMKHDTSGFTLMELLVVVAIIGILVSLSVASYVTAQVKTRDNKRKSDMKEMQSAWEQYYGDNNATYPSDPTCTYSAVPAPGEMSATYLPAGLPSDPRSGTPYPQMYTGWRSCSATTYCFCAGVEVAASGNSASDCGGNPVAAGYKGLFCVNQLQ